MQDDDIDITVALETPQIESFWADFSSQLSTLESLDAQGFVERANEVLHGYAPGLAMELEGGLKQPGAKLVITAHGSTNQFENAQAVVRHAPHFAHYSVQAFRSRSLGSDFGMRMDGFELTGTDIQVGYYNAGGITGLELSFAKEIPQDMAEHAQHMAFIMLDHVLGEWDFSVRVGPVDFVDAISPELSGKTLLSALPAAFDAFVRDELGRTYEYPQEQDSRWLSMEVRSPEDDEDDPADILSFHDSANAVATRADLSYLLEWFSPFESQEDLDSVRAAQEALDAELSRTQRGITVFTRIEGMRIRAAAFYVDDPVTAKALAHQLAAQHAPGADIRLEVTFDPSWNEYIAMYGAIHSHGRPEE